MAKFRSGKGNCDVHGEFDWSGYQLSPGEAVFGKWMDISSNFIECEKTKEGHNFIVACPICKQRYVINFK